MKQKLKTKFRLLPYQALAKHWLPPALWMIPAGLLLWWIIPRVPQVPARLSPVSLIVSVVGLLITVYALLAKQAHVSFHSNRFVIHTPVYPMAFSYRRVDLVRPTEFRGIFPPDEEKRSRWRLYKNIWGKTTVVVSLKGYPMPVGWLRLWFHPFLIHPKETAVILTVEDWMSLSRTLEDLRTEWRER
jgi:hypothetical protein